MGWRPVRSLLSLLALLAMNLGIAGPLPDARITPGALNPDVTQATIGKTICVPGWTATVRPPASKTDKIKRAMLSTMDDKAPAHYELDHLISLQLGGHPSDPSNLWPESYAGSCGARVKDRIEGKLKRLVCSGKMTLESAQTAIRTDWVAAYRQHIGPLTCTGAAQ